MADFITLSCPTCGSKLQITPDLARFSCLHCANEHIVRRGGGLVSLSPVVEGLKRIDAGVNLVAAEMAVIRLPKEIEELDSQLKDLYAMPAHQVIPGTEYETATSWACMICLVISAAGLWETWLFYFLVPMLFFGFLGLRASVKRTQKAQAWLNEQIYIIQTQLSDKQAALTRNRQLLSS